MVAPGANALSVHLFRMVFVCRCSGFRIAVVAVLCRSEVSFGTSRKEFCNPLIAGDFLSFPCQRTRERVSLLVYVITQGKSPYPFHGSQGSPA